MQTRRLRSHRAFSVAVLLLGTLSLTGCNRRLLGLFFDLPNRTPAPSAVRNPARAAADSAMAASPSAVQAVSRFIPFNGSLAPDSVVPRLPRDHAGNIDWSAALRSGVIRPQASLGDESRPTPLLRFSFDVFLPPSGKDTTVVTWFPHSSHTEWLSCNSCHTRSFRYRRPVKMSMDLLGQGKYCGECHGTVAFGLETGCERCHPKEELPAGEAKPELLGTVRLRRVAGDTLDPPPAVFPHWVHRSRFVCAVCHDQLFEMKAGRAKLTMDLLSKGKACGVCHDGKRAFSADFGACERCHVARKAPGKE